MSEVVETIVQKPKRRWFRRLLRSAVLIYVGVCVVMYALQNQLMFPGSRTQGQASAIVRESPRFELIRLKTSLGDDIVAMFGPALDANGVKRSDTSTVPTVILFYGNGMSMADCMSEFFRIRKMGVNMAVVEYPGFGMSGGKVGERAFYAAADAIYEHLQNRNDVNPKKIVPMGLSLGGAMAIDLASRKPCAGVITISAFTTMPDMAQKLLPWLPARWLCSYKFDNESKIATLTCPILIAHGTNDTLVPFSMSERLKSAAKHATVTHVPIRTNHNDVFDADNNLFDPIERFLKGL